MAESWKDKKYNFKLPVMGCNLLYFRKELPYKKAKPL